MHNEFRNMFIAYFAVLNCFFVIIYWFSLLFASSYLFMTLSRYMLYNYKQIYLAIEIWSLPFEVR